MTAVRLLSVNGWDLYASAAPEQQTRYRALEARIAAEQPDVVAVQEIISTGQDRAAKAPGAVDGLRRLAAATGLTYEVDGEPLLAVGGIQHHVGLLVRDRKEIRPVPGTHHQLEREMAGMWHAAVSVVLEIDGRPVRVMSLQLSPFDPQWCCSDAGQLLRVLNADDIPGLAGGDYNSVSLTDPDPYEDRLWHPDHAYHLDADGRVERQAAIRLEKHGRMRDCAELAGAGWEPTTGYAPTDHHGPRRVDRWMATHHFPGAAITGHRVLPLDSVRHNDSWLSDHQPVEITLDWPQ